MEYNIKYTLAKQTAQETLIQYQTKVKCRQNNVAYQVCIKQTCKQPSALICFLLNCKCHAEHKMCHKVDYASIIETISEKIKNVQKIKHSVEKIINNKIVQLSQFKDKILKIIDENILQAKLYQIGKHFLNKVQSQEHTQKNSNSLRPEDYRLLWRIIQSDEKIEKQMLDQTIRIFKKLQQKFDSLKIGKLFKDCAANFAQKIELYSQSRQSFLEHEISQSQFSKKKGKKKEKAQTQTDQEENRQNLKQLLQINKKLNTPTVFSEDDERF